MNILLVEPVAVMAQSIEMALKAKSINVYATDLGEEAVELAKIYDYDLILLELDLADISGRDVLRQVRTAKVASPVLVMSADISVDSKVAALNAGADDYLVKPFHRDELVARVNAIVRRSKGHARSLIATGEIVVDLTSKTVEIKGNRVHLTAKEYQMLELLSLRKGQCLTKEMFLNHLYGGMDEPELKIIDVFVCKLRKKIAAASVFSAHDAYVKTVWGRGYVLAEPVAPAPAQVAA